MRSLIAFDLDGETLAATLDAGSGTAGLLIVSGGTQTRVGAGGNMARLAQAVSDTGVPVFRYDRRGVGESMGDDPGFAGSGPDIAAAAAAFRAHCPQLRRIVGFGLCDGATALALNHRAAGVDALILANPWTIEPAADLPPPAAIRRRYADRLLSPAAWIKLLTGGIDYRKALKGLSAIARKPDLGLAAQVAAALDASGVPLHLILAEGDATAIAFTGCWSDAAFARARTRATIDRVDTPSHGFTRGNDPERLAALVLAAVAGVGEPAVARAA